MSATGLRITNYGLPMYRIFKNCFSATILLLIKLRLVNIAVVLKGIELLVCNNKAMIFILLVFTYSFKMQFSY